MNQIEIEIIKPQEGPQSEFVHSEADITIFGGTAGGGKTYGILLTPLPYLEESGISCTIFRRTYPEIFNQGGMWDEAEKLYGEKLGAVPNMSDYEWTFPGGMRVKFAHIQHEKDVVAYKGAQIPIILFDELTGFTEYQFFYMLSRNRSFGGDIKPFIRATTNPDAESWVAEFIAWWIGDDGFIIPERSGMWRWFIRKGDVIIWANSKEKLQQLYPDAEPVSVTFIRSTLADNPLLLKRDPGYKARIDAMPEVERERLGNGNWKIKPDGRRFFPMPNYGPWPTDMQPVCWLDPGFGGKNNTSWTIGGVSESRYKLRGFSRNLHVTDCYQEILQSLDKFSVGTMVVESNKDEGAAARDLLKLRGWGVVPYREHQNKHQRISQYVYNYWPQIDFAMDSDNDPVYMKNLVNYAERKEPDDEADSAAGCMRLLVGAKNKRSRYRMQSVDLRG